ncbi:MAG: hypothetical protein KF819_09005 [Labilithrix sp.]|nr:hypothetical protein [Labilithrix sp.]
MSKRIVLVDPSGDVLFSGVSVARDESPDVDGEEDLEPCPETMRSAKLESGLFPAVKRSYAPPEPTCEEIAPETQPGYDEEEGPQTKRGERAA